MSLPYIRGGIRHKHKTFESCARLRAFGFGLCTFDVFSVEFTG